MAIRAIRGAIQLDVDERQHLPRKDIDSEVEAPLLLDLIDEPSDSG